MGIAIRCVSVIMAAAVLGGCETQFAGDETMVTLHASRSAEDLAGGYCKMFGKRAEFESLDQSGTEARFRCRPEFISH